MLDTLKEIYASIPPQYRTKKVVKMIKREAAKYFSSDPLSVPNVSGLKRIWYEEWGSVPGESWQETFLMEASSPEEALEILDKHGYLVDGFYGVTWYCDPASARMVGPKRVLVTQSGGLTI